MGTRVVALITLVVIYMGGNFESAVGNQSIPKPTEFIEASCKVTRYPEVCINSLSGYGKKVGNSEQKLAIAAVSLTESRARSCASFLKKKGKVNGMKTSALSTMQDCLENINDSMDRLSESVNKLRLLRNAKGTELESGIKDAQTWLSSALTHQNTCLDGLDDPQVDADLKNAIKPRVEDVSRFTSNALALVNRYAASHNLQ